MEEHFRRTWNRKIISSEGYWVRPLFPTGVQYSDARGQILIDSEASIAKGVDVTIYATSIGDSPDRSQAQVIRNVKAAFDYAGWTLVIQF